MSQQFLKPRRILSSVALTFKRVLNILSQKCRYFLRYGCIVQVQALINLTNIEITY